MVIYRGKEKYHAGCFRGNGRRISGTVWGICVWTYGKGVWGRRKRMDDGTRFRYVFRSAEKEATKKFAAALSPFHVTPNQSEVLLVLDEYAPISLKELGELLICEKKSPSRLVQGLVEKGLVYKGTSQTDARYSVLYLTQEGKMLIPRIMEKEKEFNRELARFIENYIELDEIVSIFKEYLKGTGSEKKLKVRSLWE